MQDVETYMCLNCRCEYECAVCGIAKPQAGFPDSMWQHRYEKDRRMLCFDCCKPRCASQHCKTCPVCRDPECKKRKCANKIVPLNSKLLPKDAEEVRSYLCQICQYITCKCGNRMSQTMQRKTKGRPTKKEYVCVDCQNKEMQAKDQSHKVSRFH